MIGLSRLVLAGPRLPFILHFGNRLPVSGPLISPATNIPVSLQKGLELGVDLLPAMATNTAKTLQVQISEFVAAEWKHVVSITWEGNLNGTVPQCWFNADRIAGKQVRVEISDPQGEEVGYSLKYRT